jgi:hypothetical protein
MRDLILIQAVDPDTSEVLTESHRLGRQPIRFHGILLSSRRVYILMESIHLVGLGSPSGMIQLYLLSYLLLYSYLVLPV